MSNKRRKDRHDGTLGFGLNLRGTKDSDPFGLKGLRKKKSVSKPLPTLPKGGAGSMMADETMPVSFPPNFYPPAGAESVDIRRLINVPAGQVGELEVMRFQALTAQAVVWYKYGIFTDALDASLVEFIPRINGNRILRYHGDPQNNFRLSLSVGPNLGDDSMIVTQVYMKPNDVLTWHVKNLDAVINPMGVRMMGYIDTSLKRKTMSFGG